MVEPLEDDTARAEAIDKWMNNLRDSDKTLTMKRIAVLGAGHRPLTEDNKHLFNGLEDVEQYLPVNYDLRDYPSTDVVIDLSKKKWRIPTSEYDIVIAEHVAEHVPDRLAFIAECLRITKPDGLLIIEVPNWKHDSAHNTLEHYTTWGRAIFDDSYINEWGHLWKIEKVVYRYCYGFKWKSRYIPWEFLGRQIDRFTHSISGLRFFIRVKK